MSRGEGNNDVPLKALPNGVKSVFGVCVSTLQGLKKYFEKISKYLLTNNTKCAIINMLRVGCENALETTTYFVDCE